MLAMCMFAFCFSAVAKRCGFALLETDACAAGDNKRISFRLETDAGAASDKRKRVCIWNERHSRDRM